MTEPIAVLKYTGANISDKGEWVSVDPGAVFNGLFSK
jgi:hypothetical protein